MKEKEGRKREGKEAEKEGRRKGEERRRRNVPWHRHSRHLYSTLQIWSSLTLRSQPETFNLISRSLTSQNKRMDEWMADDRRVDDRQTGR